MNKLMMGVAVAAVACGCVSVNKNDGGDPRLAPPLAQDKVHLKYEVEKNRVTATDQMHCLFGFICWGSTASHIADVTDGLPFGMVNKAKNGAYAAACEAAKCDSIVGTRYDVVYKNYIFWDEATVTVTGHPAKFTGVEYRPAAVK